MEFVDQYSSGAFYFENIEATVFLAEDSVNKIKMSSKDSGDVGRPTSIGSNKALTISGLGDLDIEYDEYNSIGSGYQLGRSAYVFWTIETLTFSHTGKISVKMDNISAEYSANSGSYVALLQAEETVIYNSGELAVEVGSFKSRHTGRTFSDVPIHLYQATGITFNGGIISGTSTNPENIATFSAASVTNTTSLDTIEFYAGATSTSAVKVADITELKSAKYVKIADSHVHAYVSSVVKVPSATEVGKAQSICECNRGKLIFKLPTLSNAAYGISAPQGGVATYTYTFRGNQVSFDIATSSNLPIGLIVGIAIGSVLVVLVAAYLCGYFFLYRKNKLDDKKIKAIYSFLPQGKIDNNVEIEKDSEKD